MNERKKGERPATEGIRTHGLLDFLSGSCLVHGPQVRTESSVAAEDLLLNDGGDGQAVEAVGEDLPELDAVAAFALVVEAVDPVDAGRLVVAPCDKAKLVVSVLHPLKAEQVSIRLLSQV